MNEIYIFFFLSSLIVIKSNEFCVRCVFVILKAAMGNVFMRFYYHYTNTYVACVFIVIIQHSKPTSDLEVKRENYAMPKEMQIMNTFSQPTSYFTHYRNERRPFLPVSIIHHTFIVYIQKNQDCLITMLLPRFWQPQKETEHSDCIKISILI